MGQGRRSEPRRFPRLLRRILFVLLVLPVALILPLRWIPPPATAFMLQYRFSDGPYDYQWTALERISPCLPAAVVAAEDQKFPSHYGFDLASIRDALASGKERPRGASTISQQTVKNLYLWPGRSFVRKGIEAWLTLYLELLLPKRRILELYVNIAEFGAGTYGAQAAARRFFARDAADLGAQESALLAAVLPGPRQMAADRPSTYVLGRSDWIRRHMRHAGNTCIGAPDTPSVLGRLLQWGRETAARLSAPR